MEFGEAFSAIPTLEQKGLARRNLSQLGGQSARFSGEHERRIVPQLALDLGQRGLIGIVRHLPAVMGAPAFGRPI